MTDYFVGSSDTSFICRGGMNGAAVGFRSAYVRSSVGNTLTAFANDPPPTGATTPLWPVALSTMWVHGRYSNVGHNGYTANAQWLRVLDSAGTSRIALRAAGTGFKISKRSAAGVFTDLATSATSAIPPTPSGPIAVDMFINYSVAGQVTVYVDGAIMADTGPGVDVTTDGATSLQQADYCPIQNTAWGDYWSECLVRDTTTLGASVCELAPVTSGNTQGFTPNTVANIVKQVISDGTFVSTVADDVLSEWTVGSLPAGVWIISSVCQEARVSVGVTGPSAFELVLRTTDGTDNVTSNLSPYTGFSNFAHSWPVNPKTGTAWQTSDLTAGFNIGIKSKA